MQPLICHCKGQEGISLVETMVAAGVTIAALIGFSTSAQQASVIGRSGKAFASATEMLQERIESFRYTPTWSNVTTATGIASIAASPSAIASNFSNVTETFTLQPYPTGSQLVVIRSPNGTFSNNGVTLPTTTCVKLTIAATWTAVGQTQRSRQLSTIIAKGGI